VLRSTNLFIFIVNIDASKRNFVISAIRFIINNKFDLLNPKNILIFEQTWIHSDKKIFLDFTSFDKIKSKIIFFTKIRNFHLI
jgi:hypothetical protein